MGLELLDRKPGLHSATRRLAVVVTVATLALAGALWAWGQDASHGGGGGNSQGNLPVQRDDERRGDGLIPKDGTAVIRATGGGGSGAPVPFSEVTSLINFRPLLLTDIEGMVVEVGGNWVSADRFGRLLGVVPVSMANSLSDLYLIYQESPVIEKEVGPGFGPPNRNGANNGPKASAPCQTVYWGVHWTGPRSYEVVCQFPCDQLPSIRLFNMCPRADAYVDAGLLVTIGVLVNFGGLGHP